MTAIESARRIYELEEDNKRLRRTIASFPARPWLETDHPDVVDCMGSEPECAANGCQLRNPARVEPARTLYRSIGMVRSLIERKSSLNEDEQAQLRMLKRWEEMAQKLGWPEPPESGDRPQTPSQP